VDVPRKVHPSHVHAVRNGVCFPLLEKTYVPLRNACRRIRPASLRLLGAFAPHEGLLQMAPKHHPNVVSSQGLQMANHLATRRTFLDHTEVPSSESCIVEFPRGHGSPARRLNGHCWFSHVFAFPHRSVFPVLPGSSTFQTLSIRSPARHPLLVTRLH
jgi:hypothetical protein